MSDKSEANTEAENNVEMWKMKKLIKNLENARGAGTSMISLIIPPGDQISRLNQKLADEYGTASNIKNRVNKNSVLTAITSAQQKLKLYNKVPPNGLIIYCGTILTDEGKEKKVNFDFEPFRKINTSLYLCDNKFHTEALSSLLESEEKFGFVVIDGSGAVYAVLTGNSREVLYRLEVDLPKKHGRGGQSALRFARLRLEKRHNYLRKCAELCTQFFITNDKVNVTGIIFAGLADFKTELAGTDMLDQRVAAKVIKIVDVSYGGDNGLSQAIELCAETLQGVKFIQEKKLISKFFEEIAQDTGKICYGVKDTLFSLDGGAVETLIIWENMDITRYTLKHEQTGAEVIKHLTKEQAKDATQFMENNVKLEVVESEPLIEWLANNYKKFGAVLEIVTNRSEEGSQFCKGFGGIGGLLRYKIDLSTTDEPDEYAEDDLDAWI